jgi:hypothetical protein
MSGLLSLYALFCKRSQVATAPFATSLCGISTMLRVTQPHGCQNKICCLARCVRKLDICMAIQERKGISRSPISKAEHQGYLQVPSQTQLGVPRPD